MNIRTYIKKLILKSKGNEYRILSYQDSIDELIKNNKSLSRFGDGELNLICGEKLGFQDLDSKLSKRLEEVLRSNDERVLIGIPDVLNYEAFAKLTDESRNFWVENIYKYKDVWAKYLDKNNTYASANVTRFYIRNKDKGECDKLIQKIMEIWKDKDVIVIEGNQTRFGVGNDILKDAKSVKRVLCPAENAFSKYDEILSSVSKLDKNTLFLVALGPTASVLTYDLAKLGFRAIDIGHLDLEYEWYLKRVNERVQIEGKYINELNNGNNVEEVNNSEYQKQILFEIK